MSGAAAADLHALDLAPGRSVFLRDALDGLSRPQKALPAKYFYDTRGSELFEEITHLEEYYPTRTEIAILEARAGEIAALAGPGIALIEPGAGATRKVRILLDRLERPAAFLPVDISGEHLVAAARHLAADYPDVPIVPVVADYTRPFDLPLTGRAASARRLVFFPGSTIGNLDRTEAGVFLRRMAGMAGMAGGGGIVVVGVDLKKDQARLEAAYDDASGVTADFNMNLLRRMNAELGADFDLATFRHRALWNADQGRIEMHLESLAAQTITLGGRRFDFRAGETIHTENSHKFDVAEFQALAAANGLVPRAVWTDAERLFSVHYLEAE
ncbi:MAG: L-histidine N(alpha)-methyltransferase [Alphaproteobacteria bacterium]